MRSKVEVLEQVKLPVPPAQVWKKISDFGDLSWNPGIKSCVLDKGSPDTPGAVRTLVLGNGGKVVEELILFDPKTMTLRYKILSGALPVKDYVATTQVSSSKEGSTVTWTANFEPVGISGEDAKKLISNIFKGGLAMIQKAFNKAAL
eukprot:TRINITY_DN1528_c0_g1_i1.p1 TRINITY_DN1528_c0_g1~~TRINITY_DN1528_c0_g1_i1.p1  ORF type:complete len:147 (+),score=2.02 TRINITY_DN1528_c0_g1_i1:30-470(+)